MEVVQVEKTGFRKPWLARRCDLHPKVSRKGEQGQVSFGF
jgi:hypothetical protein